MLDYKNISFFNYVQSTVDHASELMDVSTKKHPIRESKQGQEKVTKLMLSSE